MQETLNETQDYTERLLNNVIDGLPNFVGALALLLVSYLVAKALQSATDALAHRAQLNNRLHMAQGGGAIQRAVPNPSDLASRVVFWIVFLFGVSLSIAVLGVPFLNDILRSVYGYLPNVLAALIIFLVASGVSVAISAVVSKSFGETVTGKIVATGAPILVMSVGAFMILNQLRIAPEIVMITYAAIVGSAALGMALAFGLGGRDVAGTLLKNMYDKSRSEQGAISDDIKSTAKYAKRRARQEANRAR